jgi:hypothetical protein
MKGLELPINVMVILVLGIIILIAVIALIYGAYPPSIKSVDLTTVKNSACQVLTSMGCGGSPSSIIISNFDANNDGKLDGGSDWTFGAGNCARSGEDNLASLCECYYSIMDEDACKTQICDCP